jgi:hypothetical protein
VFGKVDAQKVQETSPYGLPMAAFWLPGKVQDLSADSF